MMTSEDIKSNDLLKYYNKKPLQKVIWCGFSILMLQIDKLIKITL